MTGTEQRKLEEKVFAFIKEYDMLSPGDKVVAGVSGGADSVCLLSVLREWSRRYGLELAVVHVHHGIREEAEEDLQFVEKLCGRYGVPFYAERADVPALAIRWQCGEEEAGRRFRYEAFERIADRIGAGRIAVAHNLNDLSETMLFHLFRGSGIRGLSGIPAVRGKVIRPLLCVERGEIEAYLEELGQDFCRDGTNEKDDYTRNRIRHHVLPYVEENIVSGCVQHMGQTARLLAETEDYLTGQTKEAYACCVTKLSAADGGTADVPGYALDCSAFAGLHTAIQKRLLYELILRLSPGAKDITGAHVAALMELLLREGNRQVHLPFGIRAQRIYNRVELKVPEEIGEEETRTTKMEEQLEFSVLSRQGMSENSEKIPLFPQNEYTKWFDYDKMKKSPIVRTREAGDYLTICDAQGRLCHKKLKEYMVNAKIPAADRDKIPVLAEGSHVIWLVGYRISEYYKVTEQTEHILQVRWKGNRERE